MKTLKRNTFSGALGVVRSAGIKMMIEKALRREDNQYESVGFRLPNRPDMLHYARSRVAEFASLMPFNKEDICDITLAVGEALDNAVVHCEQAKPTSMHIELSRMKDRLHIDISDAGEGFDPTKVSPPKDGDLAEHGRGITIMKAVMDNVGFSCGESGTKVTMEKKFRDII